MDITEIVLAAMAVFGVLAGAVLTYKAARDRVRFDSYEALQEAWEGRNADHDRITSLRARIIELETELEKRDRIIDELTKRVEALEAQNG